MEPVEVSCAVSNRESRPQYQIPGADIYVRILKESQRNQFHERQEKKKREGPTSKESVSKVARSIAGMPFDVCLLWTTLLLRTTRKRSWRPGRVDVLAAQPTKTKIKRGFTSQMTRVVEDALRMSKGGLPLVTTRDCSGIHDFFPLWTQTISLILYLSELNTAAQPQVDQQACPKNSHSDRQGITLVYPLQRHNTYVHSSSCVLTKQFFFISCHAIEMSVQGAPVKIVTGMSFNQWCFSQGLIHLISTLILLYA